ncbi:MAG: trypsin-like peptidase domain-containing protein [Acidimicrobiia bacterium]|nr:trypsin-like peptidase domain-containing protein [Acidimicrobiia bacterium]
MEPRADFPSSPPVAPSTTPSTAWAPPFGTSPAGGPVPREETGAAKRPGRARLALVGGVAATAMLAGSIGGWLASSEHSGSSTPTVAVDRTSMQISGKGLDVGEVLAKVEPSVVSVETQITESNQGPFGGSGTATGAGTGIVLDTDGTILTNAHVIEDATSIEVTVPGSGSPRAATLIASDTANDLALLRVSNTAGLVAAPLGSSADLQVGDDVVAIGNALALEGGLTVTEGIVSATGRSLQTDTSSLHGLIQTDAAISSGNSGGPLVNAKGQVVGINTAVATSSGSVSASNIGFAISIDQAEKVISAMRR